MSAVHSLYREADSHECQCGQCEGKFVFRIEFGNGITLNARHERLEVCLFEMAAQIKDWGGFYNLNDLQHAKCH